MATPKKLDRNRAKIFDTRIACRVCDGSLVCCNERLEPHCRQYRQTRQFRFHRFLGIVSPVAWPTLIRILLKTAWTPITLKGVKSLLASFIDLNDVRSPLPNRIRTLVVEAIPQSLGMRMVPGSP